MRVIASVKRYHLQEAMKAKFILLAFCCHAYALNPSLDVSQYAHAAWTFRDGVFKNSIVSIAQAPDGYLWLATIKGLMRFDGVRSVPWQPAAGQQLPDSFILKLLAGRDGRMWIGTRGGLASWKDGKLTHYPEVGGEYSIPLLEDREGTVWVEVNGLKIGKLCAIRGGETRCYGDDSNGLKPDAALEDSAGNLWFGGLAALWHWKPGAPKLYRMPDPQLTIHALVEGDHGEVLMAVRSGIKRLVNGKVEALPLPAGVRQVDPRAFLRDRDGGLWVGTDAGLLHIHSGNARGRVDRFAQPDGLSGDVVGSLFEDREGNVWAATTDGGLDRFREFAATTISARQGLSQTNVASEFGSADGSVWIGTTDGLDRWKDGHTEIYRKRDGLPDDDIEFVVQERQGRIWVFTIQGPAYFENGRFKPVSGMPSRFVRGVTEDAAGSLWLVHDQGLFHLVNGKLAGRTSWESMGRKDFAMSVLADAARGGLWLGFFSGGVAFFKDGEIRQTYSPAAGGLGKGIVGGLHLDGDGTLWAATEGGLSRLKNGRITTLGSGNGLPCEGARWVIADDDQSLWMSTSCGLVRIVRSELDAWGSDPGRAVRFTVLGPSDGALDYPAWGRVTKGADGKIWFVALRGVGVVDPRHLPFNNLPPQVHIEEVVVDRTARGVASGLRLPALSRDLEIDYTALSLVATEKNRFRVKLEGWDGDWKDAGNERWAFYSNLPPRSYRFRVMASNNSGVWNETGDSLEFSIDPAYYQMRWFQAGCAAAFLALLWGMYRYRLHQIARGFNMRLDERVNERTRLARDLHDTLLQGFQGLILKLQAVNELLPRGQAKDELEQTLDGADRVVAESRKAVHDLRLSTVITNDLARAVRALGDELAGQGSATFGLVVEGETRELHPIVRDEIYRIAREALRNAFTHARARHIEAEITYAEQVFRLRIRDDGEGIAPAMLEEGRPGHYGLPGMRERAAQIGAKLDLWSGEGTGTEIDLSIGGSIAYGKRPGGERAE